MVQLKRAVSDSLTVVTIPRQPQTQSAIPKLPPISTSTSTPSPTPTPTSASKAVILRLTDGKMCFHLNPSQTSASQPGCVSTTTTTASAPKGSGVIGVRASDQDYALTTAPEGFTFECQAGRFLLQTESLESLSGGLEQQQRSKDEDSAACVLVPHRDTSRDTLTSPRGSDGILYRHALAPCVHWSFRSSHLWARRPKFHSEVHTPSSKVAERLFLYG